MRRFRATQIPGMTNSPRDDGHPFIEIRDECLLYRRSNWPQTCTGNLKGSWWENQNDMKKFIKEFFNESDKDKVSINFAKTFECTANTCVPFTYDSRLRCVAFYVGDFAVGPAKSEGILSRGGENASTLSGFYCAGGNEVLRADIDQVIGSIYLDR